MESGYSARVDKYTHALLAVRTIGLDLDVGGFGRSHDPADDRSIPMTIRTKDVFHCCTPSLTTI